MIEPIAIPIEVHDRFSAVLGRFQDAIDNSVQSARHGARSFESWQRVSQALQGTVVNTTAAWKSFAGASASAAAVSTTASVAFGKAAVSRASVEANARNAESALASIGNVAAASADRFLASAAAFLRAGKSLAASLVSGFVDAIDGLLDRARGAVESAFTRAFSKIQGSLAGPLALIFEKLTPIGLGAVSALFGRLASAVGGFLKRIFSKPSVEQYARSSASALAGQFGVALTAELEAVIKQSAARIAAVTGREVRRHMAEAKWMPDTLNYIIAQIDEFSASVQDQLARSLEDHTKAVLINIMKMTEGEAAGAMAGTFEAIINKALETGNVLSAEIMRMLEWARRMGAEIEVPAEAFEQALQHLIRMGEVGSEKFENLILLAGQLGVSLEGGFRQSIDSLQAELDRVNSRIIGIFERELTFREQRIAFKHEFISAAAQELLAQDASLGKEKARALALERYRELQEKVKALFADGVVSLEELRSATEGMTREEKKTFLQLARQREERQALRREARQESALRETQRKLLEAINSLVRAMGGEFAGVSKTLATFHGSLDQLRAPDLGLLGQLREAHDLLSLFGADLKGLGGAPVVPNAIAGQGGFDLLFHGPPTGYPVPVVLHGTERLTATPRGRHSSPPQVVFNLTVQADSPSAGRSAGEAILSSIQRALDTKRLRVPLFSLDSTRV